MRRRTAILSGGALVCAGLLLGPYAVAPRISSDGVITSAILIAYVRMFQAALILAGLTAILPAGKCRRILGITLYGLIVAGFIEGACAVMFKARVGQWHFYLDDPRRSVFERHPYLVGVPRPGAETQRDGITITHTPSGYRGPSAAAAGSARARLVAIGGSSTYCVGVSDNETWPYFLGQRLSNEWDVINLGVPGYSTAEHVIQAAFRLGDLHAERAVFYVGWNDARNYRVAELAPDYANFHGRSQYHILELPNVWMGLDLAAMRIVVDFLQRVGWLMKTPDMDLTPGRDDSEATIQRGLDLYARNIRSLIALCRDQGVEPVFVPQIINEAVLTGDKPYGWLPFVADKELPGVIREYNDVLVRVTRERGVLCATNVLAATWEAGDFKDQGHFTPEGNRKFARLLAENL